MEGSQTVTVERSVLASVPMGNDQGPSANHHHPPPTFPNNGPARLGTRGYEPHNQNLKDLKDPRKRT